ncbi:hypothetical protein LIER_22992 [Lithospermum erythrorhizon]|uniref:Uncharacterized protein n=1 Tax=Lithospermum erythrorhizon TaxID=34254 RepID=A0AAV3QZH7_LITER
MELRDVVKYHIEVKVGSGKNVSLWYDAWLPDGALIDKLNGNEANWLGVSSLTKRLHEERAPCEQEHSALEYSRVALWDLIFPRKHRTLRVSRCAARRGQQYFDSVERRKNKSATPSQVPAPQVDPAEAALHHQLNDLKRMMASVVPTG